MRVIVVGSKEWSNYSEVMRQITLLLEDVKYYEDNNLTLVHTANKGAEDMITEYVGKVDKFLKQKGYHIKEEIYRNSMETPKSTNDYNMISLGADYAIIFRTQDDKRASYCEKMLQEFNIPYKVIKN